MGVDFAILAVHILGISSIMGSINIIVTIFNMRAPGMTMMRMPLFCWNMFVTALLTVFSLPVLTAGFAMLWIDRNLGANFFNPQAGGDPILYQHIFWFFGHPEVYIIALPFFGIITEILPVFSRKPIFGYVGLVDGILARLKAEMPGLEQIVATGGQAEMIAAGSEHIRRVEPRLTLTGLRLIHALNRG